jgi:hypothetical protein
MPEETGDDPLQELRADSAPRHLVPAGPGVAFAPWEKPRKQYVRHYQWRVALEKVIQRLPPNQSVISYLGLIGPRLLDIRDFAPICVGAGKKLKFLGFKSRSTVAEDTTLSLGLHELRSRGMVLPSSDVIPDDIESLADSRSVAYSRAEEYGPFDVVNLDLCDSIADGGGSGRPRHFDVITRLIAVQRGRRSPWALLLTCRGDKGAVDGSDFTRMSRYVAMNIQTASGFRSRFEEMFSAPLGGLFAGGREICLGDVE